MANEFTSERIILVSGGAGDPLLLAGTADPSAGAGLAAPEGSLYYRFGAGAGQTWYKEGAANTAWQQLPRLGGANAFTGDQGSAAVALADAATIATDCSLGNVFTVSLAADRNLGAPTNMVSGHTYMWIFTSVGAGRVITFNAAFLFPNGAGFTTGSGGAASIDVVTAVYNGANFLCVGQSAFA
jgi:hypothetical protein